MKNPFTNLFGSSNNNASNNMHMNGNFNGSKTIDKNLFVDLNHPDLKVQNEYDIENENQSSSNTLDNTKKDQTDETQYENMSLKDKYNAFMTDTHKMFYLRGKSQGYCLKGDDEAREEYVKYLITEFRSVMRALIEKTSDDLLGWQLNTTQSDKLTKRMAPIIQDRKDKIAKYEGLYAKAIEKKGVIEHAIHSYINGFDRGTDMAWEDLCRGKYDENKYKIENK